MNVGLIADDAKKKLMQNCCIAYRGILSRHQLYATGTTGRLIQEAAGLNVHKLLEGHVGGEQQMSAMIEQNQMDLVLYFRDPDRETSIRNGNSDLTKAIRSCDIHNIPLATNIASAEILLKSLDRGDLDWREMYR
ncbi:MAG TPA: methylglyoxal synthase [Lachnospiraceae bacterium]|jgi:methylglyoxal synthase|nr:methylglyoxal synthase [Lachnospiraceae bacterium]HCE73118.1 methylglyoxal synthase [Lachnospiraceae bacterium]HCG60597.1 methylglyoxal synthase [Lachnospiraceae bacterium]HCI83410.1 methylglyoxal synthase [Lachnospiraceae bacterium]